MEYEQGLQMGYFFFFIIIEEFMIITPCHMTQCIRWRCSVLICHCCSFHHIMSFLYMFGLFAVLSQLVSIPSPPMKEANLCIIIRQQTKKLSTEVLRH